MSKVLQLLDSLGIKRASSPQGGWIKIICPSPMHNDNSLGSCGVNLETGAISCFSCNYKGHINNLSPTTLDLENETYTISKTKQKQQDYKPIKDLEYSFTYIALQDRSYYLDQRKISQKFINKFKIQHCLSGFYKDYMIIPIVDLEKGIEEFEARKLFEYEKLKEFYNSSSTLSRLKATFNLAKFPKYENDVIDYLQRPKVLYMKNSRVKETLWNIDNLDYNKELYLTEGFGSIPVIYDSVSENVSCLFGTKLLLDDDLEEGQIIYLRKFSKIILIPDNDEAGFLLVRSLMQYLNNLYILPITCEDTSANFIDEIKNTKLVTPAQYVSTTYLLYF